MKLSHVKYFIISLATLLTLLCGCEEKRYSGRTLPVKELRELDRTLAKAASYAAKSAERADSLRRLMNASNTSDLDRWQTIGKLAEHYRPRMADSSVYYSNRALAFADSLLGESEQLRSRLYVVDALGASGFFSSALHKFQSIQIPADNEENRLAYWFTGRRLYSNICDYIGVETSEYDDYRRNYIECDDSLIKHLPADSQIKSFIISERNVRLGKTRSAREALEKLIGSLPADSNLYAMAAFQLALVYRTDDPLRYASYLAIAATSDAKAAIRDGFALPALALWLYESENFTPAFQYINAALDDAYKGNARMRMVKISQWMPSINEAYRNDLNHSRNEIAGYSILLSALFVILIGLLIYLIKRMKKRREAHTALSSVSKLKDSYIRDFINLCSVYSEKYDSLAKTVTRKVSSGQAQELLKIVKYGKISEQENEEFYNTIDSVFLNLYPDFIEKINALLQEDERFDVNETTERLNPELRIYGFIRLGVTESSKIARILNYSVNTVYAYRNRMRNRAINRDTFDEDVARIDAGEDL